MDESFIHHHSRAKDSLYHPTDAPDLQPKEKHKGQRLCFIAGILSDGPDDSHVLGLHIFKGGRNQPKDYHGMFDHAYFVKWFAGLLDQLDALGKVGAIIVLDNASYHIDLPDNTPKGNWAKPRLLEACGQLGNPASDSEYKSEIWEKVRRYIKENVQPVIVSMAAQRGHTVKYTPPYHSRLQPIELVWACGLTG
ncbi:hypothetical protein ACHHYP_20551 [Achlya hypogyna]|uniref:Tc1-like transposase DDE domain-containing protein n=1 Tax=Achlya hypogyna TaxID=1202772 RepID=A0A1V9YJ36_ACHHY|nr:hypothetical protein ACHHYP_20551 [Achlya hypogyna]